MALSAVVAGMVLSLAGGQARAQVAAVPTPGLTSSAVVDPVALGPDNVLYLAGRSHYGALSGHWVVFDAAGAQESVWPDVDGPVLAGVPDGAGGWFIAGVFAHVGGQRRAGLAHIEAGGLLDPAWAPAANHVVNALAVLGGTVYVGGEFTSIDGQPRAHLAALDGVTGRLGPWSPQVDDEVQALAGAGGVIYAGGSFSRAGGAPRGHLAAFDAGSGALSAWDPDLHGGFNPGVEAFAVNGGTLYVAGGFMAVGPQKRRGLAAFDIATGALTAWDPRPDFEGASAIAVAGETVYVGGDFDRIGNAQRSNLAAVDARTGQALPWRADVAGFPPGTDFLGTWVSDLAVVGDQIYVGGLFATVAGQPRRNLAAVNATTGVVSAWDPHPSDEVTSLAGADTRVAAGGDFDIVNGQYRDGLAAIDLATGALLPFSPRFSGTSDDEGVDVEAAALHSDTVFVGGALRDRGGRRLYLVSRDARTGRTLRSNALGRSIGEIDALAVHGRWLYLGGWFGHIRGRRRTNLGAIDIRTGRPTGWRAHTNGIVELFVIDGHTLYVEGHFTRVNGHRRIGVAAIDLRSGRLTAWNPNVDNWAGVSDIAVAGRRVYLAGIFHRVGGRRRARLAAVNRSNGRLQRWNPRVNGAVNALAVIDDTVYIGGSFTSVSGAPRRHIAAIDAGTGKPTSWNPGASAEVFDLVASSAGLLASGEFGALGGVSEPVLGMFPRVSQSPADATAPSARAR